MFKYTSDYDRIFDDIILILMFYNKEYNTKKKKTYWYSNFFNFLLKYTESLFVSYLLRSLYVQAFLNIFLSFFSINEKLDFIIIII